MQFLLRSLRFGIVSCAILAASLAPASADVIYNGGAPDQGGDIFSQTPFAAAMTFELQPGETEITGLDWWGGCYPATTCGAGPFFDVSIWSDNSGVPGSVLDFRPVPSSNQTDTGNLIGGTGGFEEYSYSASITSITDLSANTPYFLVIQETGSEPSGTWGWETTSSAPSGASLEWFDGTQWNSLPETLACDLTGPTSAVPEPADLPLLCTGIIFSIALWKRSRRRAPGGRLR